MELILISLLTFVVGFVVGYVRARSVAKEIVEGLRLPAALENRALLYLGDDLEEAKAVFTHDLKSIINHSGRYAVFRHDSTVEFWQDGELHSRKPRSELVRSAF